MKTMPWCAFAILLAGVLSTAFSQESVPPIAEETRSGEVVKPADAGHELTQRVQNKRRTNLNPRRAAESKATGVQARHLITVANDYIVEVCRNGKRIPDAKRELLEERFGATAERITVDVRKGDWLVFHVVHNRIRWGGSKYFAV